MNLLVDMDGCVADWAKGWDELALPLAHLGLRQTKDQEDFDLSKGLDAAGRAAVQSIMDTEDFYAHLDVIDGAVEALHEMLDEGHDVRICSAPWLTNSTCAWDKSQWLRTNFGEDWPRRLILTRDKTVVRGDILWDDKPDASHDGLYVPDWIQVYYDQPYNRKLDKPRTTDWKNWREILEDARVLSHVADRMAGSNRS